MRVYGYGTLLATSLFAEIGTKGSIFKYEPKEARWMSNSEKDFYFTNFELKIAIDLHRDEFELTQPFDKDCV